MDPDALALLFIGVAVAAFLGIARSCSGGGSDGIRSRQDIARQT